MSSPASAHTGTSLFGPSPGAGPTSTVTPQKAPGTAIKDARSKSFAPTAKDSLFMLTIVMLNKDPVNVDWDQVADELGFKNASVAKTRFGQITRKYRNISGTPNSAAPTPSAAGSTPAGDDDVDDPYAGTDFAAAAADATPTPAGRVKGGRVAKTTAITKPAATRKRAVSSAAGGVKVSSVRKRKVGVTALAKMESEDEEAVVAKKEESEEEAIYTTAVFSPVWGSAPGPAWAT